MVADNDCKHQEQITDISWRSFVVAANEERAADRIDRNVFYIVAYRLIMVWGQTYIHVVEDTKEDEIGKYNNVKAMCDYPPITPLFPGENTAKSGRIEHLSQTIHANFLNTRKCCEGGETCFALALQIERFLVLEDNMAL